MSCNGPFTDVHVHTAKCSECDERNRSVLKKCEECGEQLCRNCFARCGGLHGDLDYPHPPLPQPAPVPTSTASAHALLPIVASSTPAVGLPSSSTTQHPPSSPPGTTRRAAIVLDESSSSPDTTRHRTTSTQPDAPSSSSSLRRQSFPATAPINPGSVSGPATGFFQANASTSPPQSTSSAAQLSGSKPHRLGKNPAPKSLSAAQAKNDLAAMSSPPAHRRNPPVGLTLTDNARRSRPSKTPTLGESLTLQSSSASKPRITQPRRVDEIGASRPLAPLQLRAPVTAMSDSDESDAEPPIGTRLTLPGQRAPAVTPASAAGSTLTPAPQTEPVLTAVIHRLHAIPTESGDRMDVDGVGYGEEMDIMQDEVEESVEGQVGVSTAEEEGAIPARRSAFATLVSPTTDIADMSHSEDEDNELEESGDEDSDGDEPVSEVYRPRATRSGRLSTLRPRAAKPPPTLAKRLAASRISQQLGARPRRSLIPDDDDEEEDDVGPQTRAFNAYLDTIKLPKEYYAYKKSEPKPIIDTYGLREPSKPVLRDDVLPISQADLPREWRWNDPWNNGAATPKRKAKKKANKVFSDDEHDFRSRATPSATPSVLAPYPESRATYESLGIESSYARVPPSMASGQTHGNSTSAPASSWPHIKATVDRLSDHACRSQPFGFPTSYIRSTSLQDSRAMGNGSRPEGIFNTSRRDNNVGNNHTQRPTPFQSIRATSNIELREPERPIARRTMEPRSTIPSRRPRSPNFGDPGSTPKRRHLAWSNNHSQRAADTSSLPDHLPWPTNHSQRAADTSVLPDHLYPPRVTHNRPSSSSSNPVRRRDSHHPYLFHPYPRYSTTPTPHSAAYPPSAPTVPSRPMRDLTPPGSPESQATRPTTPARSHTNTRLPPIATFLHTQGSPPQKLPLTTPSSSSSQSQSQSASPTTHHRRRLPPIASFGVEPGAAPAQPVRVECEVADGERWGADAGYRMREVRVAVERLRRVER